MTLAAHRDVAHDVFAAPGQADGIANGRGQKCRKRNLRALATHDSGSRENRPERQTAMAYAHVQPALHSQGRQLSAVKPTLAATVRIAELARQHAPICAPRTTWRRERSLY